MGRVLGGRVMLLRILLVCEADGRGRRRDSWSFDKGRDVLLCEGKLWGGN